MHKQFKILAVNPGSTSTKIGLFADEQCLYEQTIRHERAELSQFAEINHQYDFRLNMVEKTLREQNVDIRELAAVVGRGGPLKPIAGGTYLVNDRMCEDLRKGIQTQHASNLGGLIARGIADKAGIPAFIVDPVSVDEMEPLAKITGVPEISRRSLFHALNLKAAAHRAAIELKVSYERLTMIMVHLGGGISVGVQSQGKMIDVANPNESGPFSPERAGAVPTGDLVKLCYAGVYSLAEMQKKLIGNGGLVAHLGTSDGREIEARIAAGDRQAALIYEAMAYQVAKEIGAMATVVSGDVDAIVLTGGLAHSQLLTGWITKRVDYLGKVLVYPGEDELMALVEGTLRVLRQEETAREYD
ncbi:aliphatic acid kinase short-chain [Lucifera butyrica]|uniref:Probable butyrate kinase n=1 Tax=Lucifera butyrica TaxID=1351585 RepID=A0A498RAU5_9FIRM|nr:butyrate kinase [Lucifera butyrica]VBB07997.1 aliphatic acid kinase short-chain [Lucifera butyrica]